MLFKKAFVAVAVVSAQFTGVFAAAINRPRGFFNVGMDNNVYIQNDSGQTIYVMASLNPDWAFVDVIVDAALLFNGVTEIKSIVKGARLPATLTTIKELFTFVKIMGQLQLGMLATASRPGEAVLAMRNAIMKNSIPIRPGEHKNVKEENALGLFLNADGIASLLGASNVSLMVMTEDGNQVAMYNTGSDDSWIATNNEEIVRSKYGTVSEKDWTKEPVSWPKTINDRRRPEVGFGPEAGAGSRNTREAGFAPGDVPQQPEAPQTGATAQPGTFGSDVPTQQPTQQPPQGFEQPQAPQAPQAPQPGFPQQPSAPQGNVPQQPETPQGGVPQQPEAPQGTVPQQPEAPQQFSQPQVFGQPQGF